MIAITTLASLSLLFSVSIPIISDSFEVQKKSFPPPTGYTSVFDFEHDNYQKFVDYGDYSSYFIEKEFQVPFDHVGSSGTSTSIVYDNLIGFAANYVLDEDLFSVGTNSYNTGGYPLQANYDSTYGRGNLYPWDSNFPTQTLAYLMFENNSPFNYSLALTLRDVAVSTAFNVGFWVVGTPNFVEYHNYRAFNVNVSNDFFTLPSYSTSYIYFLGFVGQPSIAFSGVSLYCNNLTQQFVSQFGSTNEQIASGNYDAGQEYATTLITEPNAIIDLFETIAGFFVNSFLAVALIPCFGSNLLTIFLILLGIVLIIWVLKVVRG